MLAIQKAQQIDFVSQQEISLTLSAQLFLSFEQQFSTMFDYPLSL